MIKLFLGIIALAEVLRLIVDITNIIDSRQTMKQTLINTKNAVEINANNLELTKSYGDKVESFYNTVQALNSNQKVLNDMLISLDKRMKVLEKGEDDVR